MKRAMEIFLAYKRVIIGEFHMAIKKQIINI